MPFPIPRWVMSSPSHITTAVPAVHVRTISAARGRVEVGDHVGALEAGEAEQAALALVQCEHEAGGLDQREADGDVARPLGDLLLPDLAFLLPLLELRDHHLEQLHDDRRRDVRHDPEEEDRDVGDRSTGEQVEEADDAAVVRLVLEVLDRGRS